MMHTSSSQALAEDLATRWRLKRHARSWGGDCPACGYHGAFWIKAASGPRPALRCANGCSHTDLQEAATSALGNTWKPEPRPDEQTAAAAREAKKEAARKLWARSTPLCATPASAYLARRHIAHLANSAALRALEDCNHPERGRFPALVAQVQDVDGHLIGAHRTYLAPDGNKAGVTPPKASLGPIWTGAIRLQPAGERIVIGEGIETSAAAGLVLDLPAWAALSAGNMAKGLQLPGTIREIVIAADHDGPGLHAAEEAAIRWRREGRKVFVARPDNPGEDFADILARKAGG